MALFRYDAAHENDAERTARHFDERGDKIERKRNSRRGFRSGQKRSGGRLLSRRRRRRSGGVLGLPRRGTEEAQLALNRSTPRCPPWPSRPQARRRSPWQAPPRRRSFPTNVSSTACDCSRRSSRHALPKGSDILSERPIRGPLRPRRREQNRHHHVGERRRNCDGARPRRIGLGPEQRGRVRAEIVKLAGQIVGLAGIAPTDFANAWIVPIRRFHRITQSALFSQ
jgi:hypothetical protein